MRGFTLTAVARRGDKALDRMRSRLLSGPGELHAEVRLAALNGEPVPDSLRVLVDKIRECAYQVTDRDIEEVLAAGWSQSQVFELAVAAAVGAGLHRREVCDRLLAEHPAPRTP